MLPPFVGFGVKVTEAPGFTLLLLVVTVTAGAKFGAVIVRFPLKLVVVADFCPAIFPVIVIAPVGTVASNTALLHLNYLLH